MSPRTSTLLRRGGLALVALAAVALVGYKLAAQMAAGPRWDSYSFLANAAQFAGRGIGYTEPARPPLISLIAAVPLALGMFDVRVIQVVDALLTLASLAGFYLLFRRRLGRPVAALATLAMLASPVVWDWLGVGYTDFAAMGLCAWALYFAVRATEEDPRLYAISFPLVIAASLMRFTSLLFVMPLGVWLLMRSRPFRHARYLALGVGSAAALFAPFALYYRHIVGNALYPYIASAHVQEAGSAAGVVKQLDGFATATWWLAAPRPIAALTIVVFFLAVVGLAQALARFVRRSGVSVGRVVLAGVTGLGAAWVARHAGFGASQVAVSAGVFLVWRILAAEQEVTRPGTVRRVPARLALDASVLAWTLAFFCFHDQWAQRVTRYYITMAPGVLYFTALGWRLLIQQASEFASSSPRPALRWSRVALAVPVAAVIVAALVLNVAGTSWKPDPTVANAKRTAAWLARQPRVDTSVVYSDMWPITSWYLGRGVQAMPLFDDPRAVRHELEVSRAAYYVTIKAGSIAAYRESYVTSTDRVLVRTAAVAQPMPQMLYLGAGWENYLEQLDDYRIQLVHKEGDYDLEGTAFLDGLEPDRLSEYSAVAAFGFSWHDRSDAERALERWVADGGTLVIDASHNLQQPTSLDGSVLFDTVIRREALPADAEIALEPAFASAHPEVGAVHADRFLGEAGETWYGAAYGPLPGSAPLTTLATVGGRPLVLERRWGRGRVYWLAYNLPWHAHLTGNASEARLISALLGDVLDGQDVASGAGPRLAQSTGDAGLASRR